MSDRELETIAAINALIPDYSTPVNPMLNEIALSLATIADALSWQVKQAIEDRREVQA